MTVTGEGGFFGSVVLYLAGTLSSAAGVGGGALNVPILYNIFGFSYHEAVVLSLCTLMGNYILQVMLNIDKRHPSKPGKPLIYWDAVLILLPAELGGSNLGVILSSIVPDTILYLFAMVVLMIAGALTLSKALDYFAKENYIQKEIDDSESSTPLMQQENGKYDDDSVKKAKKPMSSTLASIIPDYLKCCCKSVDEDRIVITDQLEIPWLVVQVVLGFWLFYAICYVVMKQFDTCTIAYMTILAIIYSLLFAEIVWGLNYLMAEQKIDPESIAEGDIHWGATAWFLPLIAFGVGILTSLLGIGGGELMGPLMLRMKVSLVVVCFIIYLTFQSLERGFWRCMTFKARHSASCHLSLFAFLLVIHLVLIPLFLFVRYYRWFLLVRPPLCLC